jgi:chromosome segregation ATPase
MSSVAVKKITEQNLSQNVEDLEEILKKISSKIENASVLNGGFDEIREEIKEIRINQIKTNSDLGKVKEDLPEIKKELNSIKDSLYHPDNGLYARIKESNVDSKRREETLNQVSVKTSSIETKIDLIENKITPIEETTLTLKKVAGEDLAQLKSITNTKNIIDKIWWAILIAMAAGLGKFIWEQIPPLL